MEPKETPEVEATPTLPEESAFYIEDDERINPAGDFLKDPTDFSDAVAKEKVRKRNKKLAIALGVFTAIVVVLGLIVASFLNNKNDVPLPPPTAPSPTASSNTVPTDPGVVVNPLLAEYKTAPKVNPGEVEAVVKENVITAGSNTISLGSAGKITGPSTSCKVTQPTDFCLAARGTSTSLNYDIYYLKDAAHSRLFENPASFKKISVQKSPVSAILPLQMGDKKLPTIVIVNDNSSGWMIVSQGSNPGELEALAQAITIQ